MDNHTQVRQLNMLILEQADHLVDYVSSATEALAHLQQVQYEVVLAYNGLCENISGFELSEKVRQRSRRRTYNGLCRTLSAEY